MKKILLATICLIIIHSNAQTMEYETELFTPEQAADLKKQSMHYNYYSKSQKKIKKNLCYLLLQLLSLVFHCFYLQTKSALNKIDYDFFRLGLWFYARHI